MNSPFPSILRRLTPKRRWAQFTLRGLFVMPSLTCVALATCVLPAERQRRAVDAIEALGGLVYYADDALPTARYPIAVQQSFLRRHLPRDYLEHVREADLTFCDDTNAAMSHLRNLVSLRVLRLENIFTDSDWELLLRALNVPHRGGPPVSDAALAHVQGLTRLEEIDLDNTQVTDEGLAHLRGLTALRVLRLRGTQVTDAGLAHLQELTRLKELWLDGTQATDAGLVHLRDMTALRVLGLRVTRVTDAGLAHLQQLTHLEELRLDNTQVTDEGLARIQGLQGLQLLGLQDTCVTDVGLARLQQLPYLRDVELGRSQVTDVGAAQLRKALPKCNVFRRRPP